MAKFQVVELDFEDNVELTSSSPKLIVPDKRSLRRQYIVLFVAAVLALLIAFVIGYLVRRGHHTAKCPNVKTATDSENQKVRDDRYQSIVDSMKANNIKSNLR